MDTVYPSGTLQTMPFRLDERRIYGPGVLDMKSGIAIALSALGALQGDGEQLALPVTLLCTSDEEVGSNSSRALIEALARQHELVICMEPALPDGSLKTARKGTGAFTLEVTGKSAHAGSDPESGVNAILEMTYQIQSIIELADHTQGTTLSVGVVRGGTRSNVIPARCTAKLDVRVMTPEEQIRLERAFAALKPVLPGAAVRMLGGWNRPPMPRTTSIQRAFQQAQAIARGLGLELSQGSAGGASDANFVAPLGIPVLDGMGPIGSGAHSPQEYALRRSLPERTALLAAILSRWRASEPARPPDPPTNPSRP
jgi:glutamate carboxypeptidase